MVLLLCHFIVKKQMIQLLRSLHLQNFRSDCVFGKVYPFHAFLSRDVVLSLADELKPPDGRARLPLRVVREGFRLGEIVAQIRPVRLQDVNDIADALYISYDEKIGVEPSSDTVLALRDACFRLHRMSWMDALLSSSIILAPSAGIRFFWAISVYYLRFMRIWCDWLASKKNNTL